MRLTVLGGCGAWPAAGEACSGYLVEHDGFRLLVDPGYAVLPRLLELVTADDVDAVLVTHGHPDHCADLHPLLRARAMGDGSPLTVFSLPGAVDRVVGLDGPGTLDDATAIRPFDAGDRFDIGPVAVRTWALPHSVPNAGVRMTAGGATLAYTGDSGPSPDLVVLARDADLFLAEATFAERVPSSSERTLSSALQAGRTAVEAGVGSLMLTHRWPGTEPEPYEAAARRSFPGTIGIARSGVATSVGGT